MQETAVDLPLLLAVLTLPMMLALVSEVGWDVFASADPADLARVEEALFSAPMMLLNNLMLAAFIGIAVLAVRWPRRPRRSSAAPMIWAVCCARTRSQATRRSASTSCT